MDARHGIVLTEMVFDGSFHEMNAEELVAACSCFVCDEAMEPGFEVGYLSGLRAHMLHTLGHSEEGAGHDIDKKKERL